MEIVLYVCLLADPTACKEEHLPNLVQTNQPSKCATVSMLYMAQWMGEHPAWKLVRWSCTRPGERSL
jgi:hypothetical protein